ncbi:unnamed protein product, partial [Prunus brigantina]
TKSSSFSSLSTARKTTRKIVPIPSGRSGRSFSNEFKHSYLCRHVCYYIIACSLIQLKHKISSATSAIKSVFGQEQPQLGA